MPSKRVIVTGATGYLGRHVLRSLGVVDGLDVWAPSRAECDLAAPASLLDSVATADVVLNLGALSSMRACAEDPALARQVNAAAVTALAGVSRRLVQVSTDLVFDGRNAPYLPTAAVRPASVYGSSKARGEDAALAVDHSLVVRLPLLFGRSHDGRRGATDMLHRAEHGQLALFTDEYRTPLHVAAAAKAVVEFALGDRVGVVHLAGSERLSRYEFGARFARVQGWSTVPWGIGVSGGGAGRPRDVSLISHRPAGLGLDAALALS